jgi:hypothetical protein
VDRWPKAMIYTELVAAIKGYCENDFPDTAGNFTSTDQINTFIQQCEERVYNAVQIPAIRRNQIGNFSAGDKYLTLPTDYLASFSMAVILPDGTQEFLIDKDVNFIRQSYPSPDDVGVPRYYGQFLPYTYIIGPTPDQSYNVELHYYYYPESIVDAGSSWLGYNFESVLLYGSLLEAAAFMKSDADVVTNYQNRYNEALALLRDLGDGKDRRSAYRDGQLRLPIPGPVR